MPPLVWPIILYKLNSQLDFGKYKHENKTVQWAIKHDLRYVQWLIDNVDTFDIHWEVQDYIDEFEHFEPDDPEDHYGDDWR